MYASRSPRFHAATCASSTAATAARSEGSNRRGAGAFAAPAAHAATKQIRSQRTPHCTRARAGIETRRRQRAWYMLADMRLGIDFGTTRTVVAAVRDGRQPLVAFDEGGEFREHLPG